jgi:hypothetical protein
VNIRFRALGYWTAAPLLMLALYWRGLIAWFQKDDFAWLGLRQLVHSPHDLSWALFAPLAQGTIRTLSDRAVFLSFTSLFGLHALPFRILAFVTCAAAIAMLSAVATRLSGSRAVGFWSAIVWTLNCAIAVPMAWSAEYDELAWPLCSLVTFWLLLRYVETGERRFYIAQCATFVLGFFVLELNVVYPAIAAAFAIAAPQARKRPGLLKEISPLFAISLIYTIVHFWFAPLPSSGPYKLHWDARLYPTLLTYWSWALGPGHGRLIGVRSTFIRSSMVWALTLGLFGFLIRPFFVDKAHRTPPDRQIAATFFPMFFPAWFLTVLAPLLPLRDHVSPEYLAAPTLGLAMWAGWAIVSGWRANWLSRTTVVLLLVIYAGFSIAVGQAMVRSFYDRSQRIRTFVLSVAALARAQPSRVVLLEGLDAELFNDAVYDRPFRLYGIDELYVVPENRPSIAVDRYFAAVDPFFASPEQVLQVLRENRALVIDVRSGSARDATGEYALAHP